MSKRVPRSFSRAFKLKVIDLMAAGAPAVSEYCAPVADPE